MLEGKSIGHLPSFKRENRSDEHLYFRENLGTYMRGRNKCVPEVGESLLVVQREEDIAPVGIDPTIHHET